MRIWLFSVCLYLASSLNAIGLNDRMDSESSAVKVSVELLLLSQNVGLLPKKGPYRPGYRIDIERKAFVQRLDLDISYSFWESQSEKLFTIPVWDTTKRIDNSYNFQNVDATLGFPLAVFKQLWIKPYAGMEWMWRANKTVINSKTDVLSSYHCYGPMGGVLLKGKLFPYLSINFDLSYGSLYGSYQRIIDGKVNLTKGFHPFRGRVFSFLEGAIPLANKLQILRICGGFESMYFWAEELDQTIHWKKPLNMQGFSLQLSLEF
ncbi:MAG: hypothetical protein KDK59_03415 [Simkania sp.]|nr:hypothetical protein [Simkania sp.]